MKTHLRDLLEIRGASHPSAREVRLFGTLTILVSYETPVAFWSDGTRPVRTPVSFSRTTQRHISAFLGGAEAVKAPSHEAFQDMLADAVTEAAAEWVERHPKTNTPAEETSEDSARLDELERLVGMCDVVKLTDSGPGGRVLLLAAGDPFGNAGSVREALDQSREAWREAQTILASHSAALASTQEESNG